MAQTLIEYTEESNIYAMDFSANLSLISPGEVLISVDYVESEPEAGLTISEEQVEAAGKRVLFRIVPDTAGPYEIRVKAVTSLGNTKQGKGTLIVRNL